MSRYYMFHKPAGCVTALKDDTAKTVMDYLSSIDTTGLRPVGRLDKDTEGLLLFTDDYDFLQSMTNPDAGIEKVYFFWALGEPDAAGEQLLKDGIFLRGNNEKKTRPATLRILEHKTLCEISDCIVSDRKEHILKNRPDHPVFSGLITLTEGRKHEVKRLLRSIGCYCIYLKRLKMGEYVLDEELAPGEFKVITKKRGPQSSF